MIYGAYDENRQQMAQCLIHVAIFITFLTTAQTAYFILSGKMSAFL